MPETRENALKRAKKEGFKKTALEKGEKGWYIVPHGITNTYARKAYVHSRDSGHDSDISAQIAWKVQKMMDKSLK